MITSRDNEQGVLGVYSGCTRGVLGVYSGWWSRFWDKNLSGLFTYRCLPHPPVGASGAPIGTVMGRGSRGL